MFDFLIPENPASLMMLVIVLFLLWLTHKDDEKDSIQKAKRHQEEKETLGTAVEITLTNRQVQRHLETILERIASEKLTKVIITNTKEAPQGVLLCYGGYRALLAFKELYAYNAEEKIKERKLWEEQAKRLSQDLEYLEYIHELR
ncbi:MAG: hypothetical protein PHX65_04815 [Sulfurimonas sp.]|nr:hypothetical protein [Sulfurimonas sp.]